MIDYEKVLNSAQLEAVMSIDGPILVIAGAGSGKTRTLIYRVARLVEQGISPPSILLLTFTRKAAQEMLERAAMLQDERCRFVSGGTFHSLANRILRRYAGLLGFPDGFSLLDRSDMEDVISSLIRELNFNKRPNRFPKKGTIASIISKGANTQQPIEELLEAEYEHLLEFLPHIKRLAHMYDTYKKNNSLMDYDDLLLHLRSLLQMNMEVRRILSRQFKYIMVDEYQDTNRIQADILEHLCFEHRNIMVVGDDCQAIYSFRGADYNNMFDFPNRFPDAKIIKLEENYRSTQPILDVTNAIMDRAIKKYTKCLYTRREGGKRPELINTRTEPKQAEFVCRYIKEQLKRGYSLKDFAVLFRAGYHSFELEAELARQRIPYVKYGGFKFLESAHIKDFLSHISAFLNRDNIVSWMRILRLIKNIGPAKAQRIYKWLKENNIHPKDLSQWPGMKDKNRYRELNALANLFFEMSKEGISPRDAVKLIMDYYVPILKDRFDDYPKRQRDLNQIISMASRYKSLKSFLDDLILEPPTSPDELEQEQDADFLTLSTVHSAKGLEWPIVIIIWAVEGRFPLYRSIGDIDSLEEERRLMYVAATRAKDHLIICYPGDEFVPLWDAEVMQSSGDNLSSFIRHVPGQMFSYTDMGVVKKRKGRRLSFNPGDRVQHPAFGTGTISRVVAQDKVEVLFPKAGRKLLHLAYTTLDKI